MERSDTEPRRIGLGFASCVASSRTAAGIAFWDMVASYGYYSRRKRTRKSNHVKQPDLPHARDVRPGSPASLTYLETNRYNQTISQ
jgi:hypothetical protein